jgi:hypothetical protein
MGQVNLGVIQFESESGKKHFQPIIEIEYHAVDDKLKTPAKLAFELVGYVESQAEAIEILDLVIHALRGCASGKLIVDPEGRANQKLKLELDQELN